MSRLLRLLLLAFLLGPAGLGTAVAQQLAPIPPLDSPVVDTTGTLDAAQRQALVQQALALQQRKGSQLQILIVPSTRPEDIAQYTTRVFEQWGIGRKGVDDGVLLVVARDDRRVRIEPGYGLEGAIPDAIANRVIQEYLVPRFRNDDYAGGIAEATAVLVRLIDGEPLPAPVASNREPDGGNATFGIALFIGGFAAVLVRLLFARRSRPMRGALAALLGGAAGWLLLSLAGGGVAAAVALFMSLGGMSPGGFARGGGFGSGGFGGGGFGGGGGWSGGGGRSGGGGASGSW
ncbi:MAG: dehydrogenase [Lysobacteraceae bacterium SCN 69-123]|uniref:TPM domain-containing protein n=1 Tax=Stenotrophomonas acidaminiphila TaxID=128780 RepID=UPI00086DA687|nr:TPM domain-containing protein [Stenotrophomonas acidaminiphila]MBN8800351.1 TPM domain-containing protein [Stenotrophomonas acidaminiphila]MDF9442848.1 YgcG family protein [Stenotrophomonas acidaminiphila]ODU44369.1 MAG: dehydrogenase [Xanthomonadaceae bacterium SCN 69-123]OJY80679.1 MAG: dehydrogenase [Stenotrophomonas sp. 69-14]